MLSIHNKKKSVYSVPKYYEREVHQKEPQRGVVYFRTRIFHCNVRETGEWVTGDWRSSMSVRDLLSNLSASLRLNSASILTR
ncbi:hypothetical protein SARC_09524 [Sphaeroforma arctica JP610]|uniref:Uncharacterized protein n=1 Tax=Sphaeroforma arctica JP610 TaxID=667725 RepID=A0A0L0FMP7_9EUKA|nr:hypothetical protein SARC_09524 [Sphaeroforma arctica JP610]KNC78030.1 hypothetical protein SARC_09524 [Sphaeroforma arctica JP610]|eukprot:XP_014151932.1 hypothetical protein SARC_09524 [Sphaeroforma arctica JP610]